MGIMPTPSMVKDAVWGHVRPRDVCLSQNASTWKERKAARERVAAQTEIGLQHEANRLTRKAEDAQMERWR